MIDKPYKYMILVWCLLFVALINSCTCERQSDHLHDTTKPLAKQLRAAIKNGATYLIKDINEEGAFLYRSNMNSDVKVQKKYNWLRHAGTIYALSVYADWAKDSAVREKVKRAARYLIRTAIAPLEENPSLQTVWSLKEYTGENAAPQAKLGGSGLALVGLLSLEKIEPGFNKRSQLEALGRFLSFMQKEDGSFYSKYIPSKSGRDDSWTSLYYPGEAALGLVMLYEYTKAPEWLEHALRALGYLARLRQNKAKVEPDHWALLATQRALIHIEKLKNPPVSQKMLREHAETITQSIMYGRVTSQKGRVPQGAYDRNARTTPIATRLEGLLAAYTFLSDKRQKLRAEIAESAHLGIKVLLESQIKDGTFKGAVPRSYFGNPENAKAPPDKRSTELRIDYNQHFISALMQYSDIFYPALQKTLQEKSETN